MAGSYSGRESPPTLSFWGKWVSLAPRSEVEVTQQWFCKAQPFTVLNSDKQSPEQQKKVPKESNT